MPIDSAQKRKSAATVFNPWAPPAIVPGGSWTQADRQHSGWNYTGILAASSASTTTSPDLDKNRFMVELRDGRGVLRHVFARSVEALSWNFDRIGGCGTFRMTLKELMDSLPINAWGDYDFQIKMVPTDGTTLVLVYRGYVDNTDGLLDQSERINVSGFGYIRKLNRIVVSKSYQNQEVSVIVRDILDSFVLPNSGLTYLLADLQATTVTASSILFNTTADQAIKTLADLVGAREWGVDRNLKFFFKRRDDYVKIQVHFKRDIASFGDVRSFDEIVNSFHLQGKDGFTYALEQSESISLWGRRAAIVVNSSITNATDAQQYLNTIMFETAKPRRQLRVRVAEVSSPYEFTHPLGRLAIMGEDLQGTLYGEKKYGEFLYGYPYQAQVNSIAYTLRPRPETVSGGVEASITAAYLPPQLGKSLKQIESELAALREA